MDPLASHQCMLPWISQEKQMHSQMRLKKLFPIWRAGRSTDNWIVHAAARTLRVAGVCSEEVFVQVLEQLQPFAKLQCLSINYSPGYVLAATASEVLYSLPHICSLKCLCLDNWWKVDDRYYFQVSTSHFLYFSLLCKSRLVQYMYRGNHQSTQYLVP